MERHHRRVCTSRTTRLSPDSQIDWMDQASCRGAVAAGYEPDVAFFPEPNQSRRALRGARRRHCAVCPVRVDCLKFALANEYTGLWGGTHLTSKQLSAYKEDPEAFFPTSLMEASA